MSVLGCIVAIVLHDSRFKAYECVTPVVAPVPLLCVGHFKLHIHISFKAFIHEMTHEFTKHYSVSDIVLKKQIKTAKNWKCYSLSLCIGRYCFVAAILFISWYSRIYAINPVDKPLPLLWLRGKQTKNTATLESRKLNKTVQSKMNNSTPAQSTRINTNQKN